MKKVFFKRFQTLLLILTLVLAQVVAFSTSAVFAAPTWHSLGNNGFTEGAANYTTIAFDTFNTPYVAYMDDTINKVSVMKYDTSGWNYAGNRGFSDSTSDCISMVMIENTPYVAYNDFSEDWKLSVKKLVGSTWVNVGSPHFSMDEAHDIRLAAASDGTLYVAYSNHNTDDKATVMKLSGSDWIYVGNAGFSESAASNISLEIDSDGKPFIAFMDEAHTFKASVMKYSSASGWTYAGSPGFTESKANDIDLQFDHNRHLYMAYADGPNFDELSVMKFNGSTWSYVGGRGISPGEVRDPSLDFDSQNVPYVAYKDLENGNRASAKKFNGSSWVYVGNSLISAGQIDAPCLTMDYFDIPYVVYTDYTRSDRATVMYYSDIAVTNAQIPVITSQPTDRSVMVGESARLSVSAYVNQGRLSYQWYRNTSNRNFGGTLIHDADASAYFPPVSAEGTRYYYCTITNYDSEAIGNKTAVATTRAAEVVVGDHHQNSEIQTILDDFYKAISDHTLYGNGPIGKANSYGKMLEDVKMKINRGDVRAALNKLNTLYKFVDGKKSPKDHVVGPAAENLSHDLLDLIRILNQQR